MGLFWHDWHAVKFDVHVYSMLSGCGNLVFSGFSGFSPTRASMYYKQWPLDLATLICKLVCSKMC